MKIADIFSKVVKLMKSRNFIILSVVVIFGGLMFWSGMRYDKYISLKKTNQNKNIQRPFPISNAERQIRSDGVIEKINNKSLTIKKTDGVKIDFIFDPKIRVIASGKTAEISVLKKGDSVNVYSRADKDNQQVANRIMVKTVK